MMEKKKEGLRAEISGVFLGDCPVPFRMYDRIDSTNSEAKRYALGGGEAPMAFIADEQSGGRGRMGRTFYSPANTGIYLSLLLPWQRDWNDAVRLTSAAAVAVHRAILGVTGISTRIKWVNDLYVKDRKVCGILAESFCNGAERYVVIGVGVNLYTEEFPEELKQTAGSLHPEDPHLRNRLSAAIVAQLCDMVEDPSPEGWLETYRERSICLGRSIIYTENGIAHSAFAEEIDDSGRLWVRCEDGSRVCLSSGEISLRVHNKNEE